MSGPAERPLSGRRVLITRAEGDSATLRARLEELGAGVVSLPVVAYEPVEDLEPLDRALRRLESYHWVVFASRNAVRIVFQRLLTLEPPESFSPSLRLAAVGRATAGEIERFGRRVDCLPAKATGADLAEAMSRLGGRGTRILLPQGDLARPELAQGLHLAGAQVDEIVIYHTVLPREAATAALDELRGGRIDVVAVASPSAVRNLVILLDGELEGLRRAALACIGPTTAEAVREVVGSEAAAVAVDQTLEGLVSAVITANARHDGTEKHEPGRDSSRQE